MAGYNRAILIGRLGRDPEVRTTQGGSKVVSFSLATDEQWKDKNSGERKQRTQWHNVVVFNENIGSVAERFLKKGSLCHVEGMIETREYTDRDGIQRKTTEILIKQFAGTITLLDQKRGDDGRYAQGESTYGQTTTRQPAPAAGAPAHDLNDDIPF